MEDRLGTVRISPHVLATIARLTSLAVPGVAGMFREPGTGVDRLIRGRGATDGVRVQVMDDAVSVDLHIIASKGVSLYDLGRETQAQVSRAIKDMVGMPVLDVNVHIEDVEIASVDEP